jgi:hypothetical protein
MDDDQDEITKAKSTLCRRARGPCDLPVIDL